MTASVSPSAPRRPRVLITARIQAAGGTETHLLHLCRALVERDAEVVLATRYNVGNLPVVDAGVPWRIVSTPFARDRRWFRASTLWAYIAWPARLGPRFDVVYTLELSRFTRFLRRFLRPGGRVVWNRVGRPAAENDALPRPLQSLVDVFIAETPMQVDAARNRFHITAPAAALPHLYHGSAGLPVARAAGRLRVAYLGRLVEGKGIFRLLDCWRTAAIDAELTFFGDGPDADELRRRAGSVPSVRVAAGWRDDGRLREILATVDLLVLPSSDEGLPLILLEAMAHGVPWIATRVGAVAALAADNPDVRVVDLDDAALTNALADMAAAIRDGRVSRERLQAYCRARYDVTRLTAAWSEALLCPPREWQLVPRA